MERVSKAGEMNTATGLPQVRETDVVERAKRRRFTAEYKQRILAEVDRVSAAGERSGEINWIAAGSSIDSKMVMLDQIDSTRLLSWQVPVRRRGIQFGDS
jgi:hypothetical protein